jgi:ribosomal protein L11 methyltransferase
LLDYILEIEGADEDVIVARLYLSASTGSTSADGIISAYFESADDRAVAIDALRDLGEIRTIDRERIDWLERYQQSLEPLFIGDRFVVAPDASLIPAGGDRFSLVIPQEQAFGTGSHETTSLCIELLETIDLRGKRGLDVGAGSGILALAMLRLGAASVVAFDNDLDALAALRENAIRNELRPKIFIGDIEAVRGAFDIATMNILPEVIIPILPRVPAKELILSGILTERRDDVVAAMRGMRIVEERTKGEWWASRAVRSG